MSDESLTLVISFPDYEDKALLESNLIIDGLETVSPTCVINGITFSGQYEKILGTKVLFKIEDASLIDKCATHLTFRVKHVPLHTENEK